MYLNKSIQDFITEVCEQIRWKKARPIVAKELENHIEDQREANLKSGMDETTAIEKSVEEMGSATDIGLRLDQIHRPRSQWKLISFIALLALSGVIVRNIFFVTDPFAISEDLFWTSIGILFMIVVYFLNFSVLARHVKISYIVLCAVVVFMRFSLRRVGGYYIDAANITITFPLAFAFVVYSQRDRGYKGFFNAVFLIIPLLFLIVMVRSIASFILLYISGFLILAFALQQEWFSTPKKSSFIILISGTIFASILLLILAIRIYPIYFSKINAIYNPYMKAPYVGESRNFVVITREVLSGAKFIGTGSLPKSMSMPISSLPLTKTILFLVLLIHKVGWIALIVVVAIMVILLTSILKLSKKYSSKLGSFVALAIVLIFGIQIVFYILFNLGVQLFSPLVFPLLSSGNAIQLINLCLLGILLSVFRFSGIIEDILPQKKIYKLTNN